MSTADGSALSLVGSGVLGPLSKMLLSDHIKHNCNRVARLTDIGVSVTFSKNLVLIQHSPDLYLVSSLVICVSFPYLISDMLSLSSSLVLYIGSSV